MQKEIRFGNIAKGISAAEQVIWELEREGRVAPGGGYGNTDNVMKCLT